MVDFGDLEHLAAAPPYAARAYSCFYSLAKCGHSSSRKHLTGLGRLDVLHVHFVSTTSRTSSRGLLNPLSHYGVHIVGTHHSLRRVDFVTPRNIEHLPINAVVFECLSDKLPLLQRDPARSISSRAMAAVAAATAASQIAGQHFRLIATKSGETENAVCGELDEVAVSFDRLLQVLPMGSRRFASPEGRNSGLGSASSCGSGCSISSATASSKRVNSA